MNWENLCQKVIKNSFYLLFILVPLILTPYNYELFEFNKMLTVYFLTAIILAAWIIRMIYLKKILFCRTPFDIPLILFLLSQIISTILSIDPHTSIWGYYSRFHGGLLSTVSYLLLYFAYTSNLKADKKFTLNSLTIILITALIVSLYAVLEHFGIDKDIWVQDVQSRVFSTLGQPNWLAAYLLTLLPLPLALCLKSKSKKNLAYYLLLITAYYLALLFTRSRSGLAGFGVAFIIFWVLVILKKGFVSFPWKKLLLITGCLLLITFLIGTDFTPSVKQFLARSFQPRASVGLAETAPAVTLGGSKSSDIRKVVWQGAVDIWKHYPVFGSGVETFAYSYYNFRPTAHNLLSEWDYLYNKAHNEFLNFLATTGAFGLISYCLIIVWFTVWSVIKLKSQSGYLIAGFLAGFLGLAVSNFFGFSVVPVALFFFLYPALSFNLIKPSVKSRSRPRPYYSLSVSQSAAVFFICLLTLYLLSQVINLWRADRIFNLGRNYLKTDQVQAGFDYLQQAVTLSPKEPLFRSEYAEAAAKMAYLYHSQATPAAELENQLINEAIANSDLVIQANPVHLNYWKSRIKVFTFLSLIDQKYQLPALEALTQAIALAPTDAKLYYNLGLTYSQLGQTGLAEQALVQAIDLKENYEASRFSLGSLYEQTHQPAKAKQQYLYILNHLNPDNDKVKTLLKSL